MVAAEEGAGEAAAVAELHARMRALLRERDEAVAAAAAAAAHSAAAEAGGARAAAASARDRGEVERGAVTPLPSPPPSPPRAHRRPQAEREILMERCRVAEGRAEAAEATAANCAAAFERVRGGEGGAVVLSA